LSPALSMSPSPSFDLHRCSCCTKSSCQGGKWFPSSVCFLPSRERTRIGPRPRPSNLTMPSPLSPRDLPVDALPETSNSPGRRKTRSMASVLSRSLKASSSRRDRKSIYSGSTVSEIAIEPPVRNLLFHSTARFLNLPRLYSLGQLRSTKSVLDLEQQVYLVQITPPILFPTSSHSLPVPCLYPRCQIYL
jgi:hypothetical protein